MTFEWRIWHKCDLCCFHFLLSHMSEMQSFLLLFIKMLLLNWSCTQWWRQVEVHSLEKQHLCRACLTVRPPTCAACQPQGSDKPLEYFHRPNERNTPAALSYLVLPAEKSWVILVQGVSLPAVSPSSHFHSFTRQLLLTASKQPPLSGS